jgi:ribosomal protein S18 acetylase RimI-like enzyme
MADVRPATPADRDAVVQLLVAQLREHAIETPEAQLAASVDAMLCRPRRGRLLVAHVGAGPVGFAALSFVWPLEHGGRSTWLEELYVVPAQRDRGIGRALLEAACEEAAEGGAVAVDLEVDAEHERASRLYARHGFTPLPRARWVRRLGIRPPAARPPRAEWAGSCFCGAIRYRITAPPHEVSHCHCGICRRTTGAAFVTWATFPAASFALTRGAPAELHATSRAVRTFCSACGTALTFRESVRPRSIDVTVGSLEAADDVVPQEHIWTSSRLTWLHLDDDLPHHSGENPDGRDVEG